MCYKSLNNFVLAALVTTSALAWAERPRQSEKTAYEKVVEAVSELSYEGSDDARKLGLAMMNMAYEDNGRTKGSVWGPLISDYSIHVHIKGADGKFKRAVSVPILRHENFSDKTADQPPSKFFIKVGNEKKKQGQSELISLADYLADLNKYLTKPAKSKVSLLSPRDTDFVVSAQASFLPIPSGKNAVVEFTPALYQYQSHDIAEESQNEDGRRRPTKEQKMKKNPAVLAILATREGTSATIIDNERDKLEGQNLHGQPLFFNAAGQRAPYTATRKSDFVEAGGNPADGGVAANGESGLGMVLMIQVPLKHKETPGYGFGPLAAASAAESATPSANLEEAVIGHGEPVGPFTELAGLKIERDERYPIRVTVQFYKAVESANLTEADYKSLQAQINRIYSKATAVGSLVTEGDTGRVTEHQGPKWAPPIWWIRPWWRAYEKETGLSEEEATDLLDETYGNGWKYFTDEPAFRAAVIEARIKKGELKASDRPKTNEELEVEKAKD